MFDTAPAHRAVTDRSLAFKSADGAELVGRLFMPEQHPFAAVILNSATGVPQKFYTHFARWLAAERGMVCLTYDYRGMGRLRDVYGAGAEHVNIDPADHGLQGTRHLGAFSRRKKAIRGGIAGGLTRSRFACASRHWVRALYAMHGAPR